MKCHICGSTNLVSSPWDSQEQKCQDCEKKAKKKIEYYSHVCKSCYTPCKDGMNDFFFERIIRSFYPLTTCTTCGKEALIPINTPKGIEIMKRIGYEED